MTIHCETCLYLQTGGGKPHYIPPDETLDLVASILGATCDGYYVTLGGDAGPSTHEIIEPVSGVPDDHEIIETIIVRDASSIDVMSPTKAQFDANRKRPGKMIFNYIYFFITF